MIGHAAEHDFVTFIETTIKSRPAVVPLATPKRAVTLVAQHLAEHGVALRDVIAGVFQVKQRSARMQHRPARHTDCTVGATWDMRVGERSPPSDQAINIGCVDTRITERTNRIEALVVGVKNENVWFVHAHIVRQLAVPAGAPPD